MISPSSKLKKYGIVYKEYIGKKKVKSPKLKKGPKKKEKSEIKKSVLNTYQKFFSEEVKKDKYRDMKPSDRMVYIASIWRKRKRKSKKQ